MSFDDDSEEFDFREPDEETSLPVEVKAIVEKLRDSLTDEQARLAYKCRIGQAPDSDAELEAFIDELVTEAYNAGYEEWDDEFIDYD